MPAKMRSLEGSEQCARGRIGFATYRSQSRTFSTGPSYFSRTSYIIQTKRLMPRSAPHLLWKINCVRF